MRKIINDKSGDSDIGCVIIALVCMYIAFSCFMKLLELFINGMEDYGMIMYLCFVTVWIIVSVILIVKGIKKRLKPNTEKVVWSKFIIRHSINIALIAFSFYLSGLFSDCSVEYMEGAYTDFKLDFLSVFPSEKVVANSFDGYEVVSGNVNDNFNDDDIEYYVVNNKFSYLSAFDMCKYFAETKMIYNYIKPTRSYNYNRVLVDKLKDFDSFRSGRNYNNDYFHCLGIICNGNKYCMVNINPNSYYDPYRSEYSILYINEEPICSFTKYGINKVSSTFENNGYFKGDITCVEPPTETTTYTQPSSSYSSSNSSSYSSSKKYNNYQYYYSDDPYNIDDYDDPEDFYYDNEDDFEDYEDAEDYFYEAKGE